MSLTGGGTQGEVMPDTPDQQPSDDTEGHRNMDTEATSEDDVEGYKYRSNMDTEATSEDDAEGHVIRSGRELRGH